MIITITDTKRIYIASDQFNDQGVSWKRLCFCVDAIAPLCQRTQMDDEEIILVIEVPRIKKVIDLLKQGSGVDFNYKELKP